MALEKALLQKYSAANEMNTGKAILIASKSFTSKRRLLESNLNREKLGTNFDFGYDVSLYYDETKDELKDLFYIGDRAMRESGYDPSCR